MNKRHFRHMIEHQWANGKFVCVGLDSELSMIPEAVKAIDGSQLRGSVLTFNCDIVDATRDLVGCYKPNIAFYEALGDYGTKALQRTIEYINEMAPEVPVILDAKRGDIGNTNEAYAKALFDYYGADAITIHPYLGREANKPFLDREEKGVFVLCRTSNLGAGEFQDLRVDGKPFYQHIANRVSCGWNDNHNCGLVAGATYPQQIVEVRNVISDNMPLLIPGIGKQGGDLEGAVKAGRNSKGEGFIINSSSGVIFASNGPDFAEAARRETQKLHDDINRHRKEAA